MGIIFRVVLHRLGLYRKFAGFVNVATLATFIHSSRGLWSVYTGPTCTACVDIAPKLGIGPVCSVQD